MSRAAWHRTRARRSRFGCLDLAHRYADLSCPYCVPADALLDTLAGRQARIAIEEDPSGFGWSS